MAANINGTTFPATIDGRGRYLFGAREILGRNGLGSVVEGDYSSVTWTFPLLSYTDFSWWYGTLLGGYASLLITTASLWNAQGSLAIFTHGVVLRPTYEFVTNYYYNNVVIRIEDLA